MSSIFDDHNSWYWIEKLQDFAFHPGGINTQLAHQAVVSLEAALQELEAKMRKRGLDPDQSHFAPALYAVVELRGYVHGQPSNIADEMEARIYLRSLTEDLEELARFDRNLSEGGQ